MIIENYKASVWKLPKNQNIHVNFKGACQNNAMVLFSKGLNLRYLCADIQSLVDLESLLFYKYLYKSRKFGSLRIPARIFL
jgi:hypothetical protein